MLRHRVTAPERVTITHAGATVTVDVRPDEGGVWGMDVRATEGCEVARDRGAWSHAVTHLGESARLRLDFAGYGFRRESPTLWVDAPRSFVVRWGPIPFYRGPVPERVKI